MAKDPAFLFYPGDWLGGTLGMTFEEKGAYMELLMLQFNRGHMTSHMIGQVVGQLWVTLQVKFVQDDKGLWYNVRLDEEKDKRKNFVSSRKNNISGKNQYKKQPQKKRSYDHHMTSHMENENVNEIVIDNTIKDKIVVLENLPFETDDFRSVWREWLEYKKEKKQKLTPKTKEMQLRTLGQKSEREAIGMIAQSITNGWTGLFDLKQKHNGKQPTASTNEQVSDLVDTYLAAKKAGAI